MAALAHRHAGDGRRRNKEKGIAGGLKAATRFGRGALVNLLLTNLEAVGVWFGGELPLNGG